MKKSIVTAAPMLLLLLIGCSGKGALDASESTVSGGYEITLERTVGRAELHRAVIKAGEAEVWIMTPLDDRTMIASKYEDGKSASVVIHYDRNSLSIMMNRTTMSSEAFEDAVEDLQEAIADRLQ